RLPNSRRRGPPGARQPRARSRFAPAHLACLSLLDYGGCRNGWRQSMRRRLAGIARRLGWDRNPVRRRVDRLQTVLTSAFLILVLAGPPLTAWLVADRVYLSGERAA